LIGLRGGTVTILVSQLEVVWKQFGQIFAVIIIVFMDIVQEKDEPFAIPTIQTPVEFVNFMNAVSRIQNGWNPGAVVPWEPKY